MINSKALRIAGVLAILNGSVLASLVAVGCGHLSPNSNNTNVYGQVQLLNGDALPGVTIHFSPPVPDALTDSNGLWRAHDVPHGDYTITPKLSGFTFTPSATSIQVGSGILPNTAFTATINPPWTHTWGTSFVEGVDGIALDSDGAVYVISSVWEGAVGYSDIALTKLSCEGDLVWQKLWGNSSSEQPFAIAIDSMDNIYIAGETDSFGGDFDSDCIILKYTKDGSLLWSLLYGSVETTEWAEDICLDSTGRMYISGFVKPIFEGEYDAFICALTSDGSMLWQKTWGGEESDSYAFVAVDKQNNPYLLANTYSFGNGRQDIALIKYNNKGKIAWQRTWGTGTEDHPVAICHDSTNGILVLGESAGVGYANWDPVVLHWDRLGKVINQITWRERFSDFSVKDVALGPSGLIYVVGGFTESGFQDYSFGAILATFNEDGQFLGLQEYQGEHGAGFDCIAIDERNTLVLGGMSYNNIGSWRTKDIEDAPLSIESRPVSGDDRIATGSLRLVVGVQQDAAGTLDADDLNNDVLVLRYLP